MPQHSLEYQGDMLIVGVPTASPLRWRTNVKPKLLAYPLHGKALEYQQQAQALGVPTG